MQGRGTEYIAVIIPDNEKSHKQWQQIFVHRNIWKYTHKNGRETRKKTYMLYHPLIGEIEMRKNYAQIEKMKKDRPDK